MRVLHITAQHSGRGSLTCVHDSTSIIGRFESLSVKLLTVRHCGGPASDVLALAPPTPRWPA